MINVLSCGGETRRQNFGRGPARTRTLRLPTCGSCAGLFTADSMNCLCEALGMALPTNGTLLATSAERKILYRRAAQRIVEMVFDYDRQGAGHGLLPREICTAEAVDNAMVLDMAMGGSTNTVLHILAIAREAGVEYNIERINGLSRRTPNVCKISPSSRYHVEDCHNAGSVHTILGSIVRGCPGVAESRSAHRFGQDAGREHRRIRHPLDESVPGKPWNWPPCAQAAAAPAEAQRIPALDRYGPRSDGGRTRFRSLRLHPRGRGRTPTASKADGRFSTSNPALPGGRWSKRRA